ncbi:MAG TPA: FixH family protein [Gallionella sp.]
MISQKNKQAWRNPWVFGLAAIVLSGVLINARMLWNVINNPVRLLDEDYSVKKHNQYDAKWLQQQAGRSTLGWHARLHSPQQLQNDPMATEGTARFMLAANPAVMQLELKDRDGKPIQGGQVQIQAQWPGAPTYDTSATLNEVAAGKYEVQMKFSRPGNWDLLIKAVHDERRFEMEQKIFVVAEVQR